MTRKEAIRELKILKENYWDDDGYGHETKQYDDTMSALDMAIKALEQDAIHIPEGATNGDMIKAIVPNAKIRISYYMYCVEVKLEYHSQYDTGLLFDKKWWNAPYKGN